MPKSAAAKREWFKITNLAEKQSAEILLYGYIGTSDKPRYDYWSGNMTDGEAGTVREFQQHLDAIPADRPVTVRIASEGGNAWDALAMHNMLARRAGPVNVVIDGFAFSAATLVAMAGDQIEMPQNALMMIHEAEWVAVGNKRAMESAVQSLNVMDTAIAKSYAGKSGKKPEDFLTLMAAETWMDGDQAKALGLVDVVTAAQTITAHFDVNRFEKMPQNFRARFDTRANPNPQPQPNNTVEPMLRPRTPLFNAAVDPAAPAAPAGGAAPTNAPANPPANPAPPPAVTPPPPAASAPTNVAQPPPAFTLADITNAISTAVKPLQDKLDAQQTEITNLRNLHSGGAAAAAQGAPPVSNAQPGAQPGSQEQPVDFKTTSPLNLVAIGRQKMQEAAAKK